MNEINVELVQEIKEQRKTTDRAIVCIESIVKDNRRYNLHTMIIMGLVCVVIVLSFIFSYFFGSYDGIREDNSSYNKNENINRNINE